MPPKQRVSLMERQQQLLVESGFAPSQRKKPAVPPTAGGGGPNNNKKDGWSSDFVERQDELLIKQGRGRATRHSRQAIPMEDDTTSTFDVEEEEEDQRSKNAKSSSASSNCGSVGGASHSSSMHPSIAGSVGGRSMACSEVTLGAGDNTQYWDYQHRTVEVKDLGHMCRECKKPFRHMGEPLTERRGARVSCRYHAECFSGFADPRSQACSSAHQGNLQGTQMDAAPADVTHKMRTASHFSGGGGGGGKSVGAQLGCGRLSFGAKSSRGQGVLVPTTTKEGGGGFTESQLAQHNASLPPLQLGQNH